MQKENLRNLEHIQNCVVLEHHHQKGQANYHGPGPGGQEGVNSTSSFKNSTPQTLYSMAKAYHDRKINFRYYLDKNTFSLSNNLLS